MPVQRVGAVARSQAVAHEACKFRHGLDRAARLRLDVERDAKSRARLDAGERPRDLLDLRPADIQMRDHAQARGGAQRDPALGGKRLQGLGLVTDLHVDHVGLHRLHLITGLAQRIAQPLGIGVVVSQALHLVIQGIQPRRR